MLVKHLAESLAYSNTWHETFSPLPATPCHFLIPGSSLLSGFFYTPGQVLNESDLDNDNMLSFSEFEHAMAKSPDFMK